MHLNKLALFLTFITIIFGVILSCDSSIIPVNEMEEDTTSSNSDNSGSGESGSNGTSVTKYTVTYDGNGGTWSDGSTTNAVTVYDGSAYNAAGSDNLTYDSSHVFLGWSTDGSETVSYATGSSITLTENLTLYAVWEEYRTYGTTDDIDVYDVCLFSQENHDKAFSISFNIKEIADTQPGTLATIVTNMNETGSPYSGFVFRVENNNTTSAVGRPITMTVNGDSQNSATTVFSTKDDAVGKSIVIKREADSDIIYVSIDGGSTFPYSFDYSTYSKYHNYKLLIGGTYKSNGTDFQRPCLCTLSNVKVIFDGNTVSTVSN